MTDQRCGPPERERAAPHHQDDPNQHSDSSTTRHTQDSRSRICLGRFAAGLAGVDLPVLPLLPRTKQPRFKGGYRSATCDLLWVDKHWHYHPDDNIGLRPPVGMIVVDIDPRNGGDQSMCELVAEHGPLPSTWVARTGSDGWHYWFVIGEMAVSAHLAAGVDIKHGGTGFVVAAPSIHPDGGTYAWLTPPMGEPAMAPGWLRELLKSPVYEPPRPMAVNGNGHGRYSLLALVRRIEAAPEGRRHDTARGAFLDAARQGDLDAFRDTLTAAALAAERTPHEIEAIIRYAQGGG